MAYPVVSAPYGLKPINLIGGQVFAVLLVNTQSSTTTLRTSSMVTSWAWFAVIWNVSL